jgi:hypothetical protein
MKYDLVRPCSNCPFRSDIKPFLRRGRGEEIADVLRRGGTFACHKTVDHSDDESDDDIDATLDRMRGAPEESHCAGALIVTERDSGPNQMHRIAMRLGMYDPDKLDRNAPVFENLDEFAEAQG